METNEPRSANANAKGVAPASGNRIRRILVAVDDTARASAVVTDAIALARSEHATLCFYEAVDVPPEFPPAAATHALDALPAYLHHQAETRLNEFARSAGDLSPEVSIDVSPNPGEAIVRAARRYRADLIVIGTHKYGIVERMLGTTIAHVIGSANCDVLTVRDEIPLSKGRLHEPPFVLVCLDDSPAAVDVYRAAVNMAQARRLPLHAFRVVTSAGELTPSTEALIEDGVRDLKDIAKHAGIGVLARASAVVEESVGRAICTMANDTPAALVVVGARRTGRLRSLAAIAPHVIRHCARPVLVVRVQETTRV